MTRIHENLLDQLAGQYAIERLLGAGGMASVWLVRDLRHDRLVALKVLHPELAGAIGIDRFLREIQVTARLQHRGVVPVLDSGVIARDDGTRLPWYTMPYIAGESLRSRLTREPQLPIDLALHIAEDVASALDAAHKQGIVHRDIKPENVLLAGGTAYVVDFGIAKALLDTGGERLTSTGLAIGTPAYMSPEQASSAAVDARTDQYSLACLVYEMLLGEPPFTGATPQALIARRFSEPARPIRPVRSTVPPAVDQALLRALERVPSDRFETVADFAAALRTEMQPRPRRLRDRPATVVIGVCAIGAVALGAWQLSRPDRPNPAVRDPEVVALFQRGIQATSRRTPSGAIEAVTALNAAIRRDSTYAAAWNALARQYVFANRRQFDIPGLSRDSVLRLAVAAADRAVAIDSGSSDAWATRASVSRAIDPTDMRVPVRWSRRAIALDSANTLAWYILGNSLNDAGDLVAGLEAFREAVRRRPSYTEAVAFVALTHYWRRQIDSAAVWADSAVSLDPSYLLGRTTAGYVALELGNHDKGIADFEAGRRVSSGVEVAITLAGRALIEARAGQEAKARSTLHLADSVARPFAPHEAHTAVTIAQAYAALGDRDAAIRWLQSIPRGERHFQLHVRCDPPFDALKSDRRYQAIVVDKATAPGVGC